MGQGPHRNWTVISCHAAKFGASHQHGVRAQIRRAEGGEYTRRSSTKNEGVYHLWLSQR